MSGWRYIACKETHGWTIREFYPDMPGGGDGWTADAIEPFGDDFGELKSSLSMMLEDLNHQWLDMTVDPPVLRDDPPV